MKENHTKFDRSYLPSKYDSIGKEEWETVKAPAPVSQLSERIANE